MLFLSAFLLTRSAFAAWGDTLLGYSPGNHTLSGYAFTQPEWEPSWPYYIQWCQPGDPVLQCEVWEYVQVEVDVRLDSPYGTYFWQSASGFYEAMFLFPTIASPAPGLWSAWSDHYVRWNRYLLPCFVAIPGYCYFEGAEYLGQIREHANTTTATESVPTPPNSCSGPYVDLWNAFIPRSATIQALYGMSSVGSVFSFGFKAQIQNASALEVSEFSTGASAWTTSSTSCGSYSSNASIQITTENDQHVDVIYVLSLPGSACASNRWVGDGNLVRDEIRLMKTGYGSGCDNHRPETVYHEIGHSLGFLHIPLPGGTTISTADLYHDPRPSGAGPRPIEGHHLRILVEKY